MPIEIRYIQATYQTRGTYIYSGKTNEQCEAFNPIHIVSVQHFDTSLRRVRMI